MSLISNEGMGPSGGVIQTIEPAGLALSAASTAQIMFMCPELQKFRLKEVRVIFGTASTSGTVTVEYLTGTQALGSGTAITAAIPLSGTANTMTVAAPTLPFQIMSPGDRLAIKIAGTMTNLANAYVQLTLHRYRT